MNRVESDGKPVAVVDELTGIRYIDTGGFDQVQEPSLVLLHGLGGALEAWTAIVERLRSDRRIIALDLPSFGLSERSPSCTAEAAAETIAGLINRLDLGPYIVVGHSYGGVVALAMSVRSDTEIKATVLINSHLFTMLGVLHQPLLAVCRPKAAIAIAGFIVSSLVPYRSRLLVLAAQYDISRRLLLGLMAHDPRSLDPGLIRDAYRHASGRGTIRTLLAAHDSDLLRSKVPAEHLSVPVFVVRAANDPFIMNDDDRMATEVLVPKEFFVIENCGHWALFEKPDELCRLLNLIVDRIQA